MMFGESFAFLDFIIEMTFLSFVAAREQEIIKVTQRLIACITMGDFDTYS